ncbi:MAG: hypothetical protein ACSLFF_02040 [Solirubrobacterales bacterium]
MATFEELNALSSKELHDRATLRAKKHVDVQFYWDLLKVLPAAEAAVGNEDQASADIFKIGSLLRDFFEAEEGDDHIEALRPFFIEYLEKHDA